MTEAAKEVEVETVRNWLADGGEIAFVDVREEGQHGEGHPLLAVNLPYSRLEREIARLVPRRSCRVVLVDDGDGVTARAARRMAGLGYSDLHLLTGGVASWSAAGHPLFPSSNVPSKAFAEIVEHELGTPAVSAEELDRLRRSGAKITVLDSRPLDEYARFHVPGAVPCPGAELVHRFADAVPSPDTFVVVSCAGRTRGIIGAQSLINAGVPNRVASLEGGTQGWRLAGLELESGLGDGLRAVSPDAAAAAQQRAQAVETSFGVRRIDHATLAAWRAEAETRTTYLLDVRTPEEFAAGHLPGSDSAPGGQLVQAIDRWVGTRGARLVLVDDTGARAVMTAHWLQQMGWDVQVLDHALEAKALEAGSPRPAVPARPAGPAGNRARRSGRVAGGGRRRRLARFQRRLPSGASRGCDVGDPRADRSAARRSTEGSTDHVVRRRPDDGPACRDRPPRNHRLSTGGCPRRHQGMARRRPALERDAGQPARRRPHRLSVLEP